jgi:hypothetical protein
MMGLRIDDLFQHLAASGVVEVYLFSVGQGREVTADFLNVEFCHFGKVVGLVFGEQADVEKLRVEVKSRMLPS